MITGGPVPIVIDAAAGYSVADRDRATPLTDLSDPATRRRLTPTAVSGLLSLADAWKLTDREVVGLLGDSVSIPTYRRWRDHSPSTLNVDQLERISLLVGIHVALHVILSSANADAWVKQPNSGPMYAGRRPLDYLLGGRMGALVATRAHLDAVRGGN